MNAQILILVFAATPSLAHRTSTPCLAGKQAALVQGHFSGEIFCSRKNASFALVGRTAGRSYAIYDYRYHFLPHREGAMHGGQRLVVFRGESYVGQYMLSPPPYINVHIEGSRVLLETPQSREKVRLDFSRKPPTRIFINGETEQFDR